VNDDLAEKLAFLRDQFARNALAKLDLLDEALARISIHRDDVAMLDRAMRIFHALGGIGTTYGFPEISRAGGAAERLCDEIAAERRPVSDEEIAALRRELDAMRTALSPAEAIDSERESAARRILVLDEDPAEASFVRMVLEAAGYDVRVCEASDYLEADYEASGAELFLVTREAANTAGRRLTMLLERSGREAIVICDESEDAGPAIGPTVGELRRPLIPALLIAAVSDHFEVGRSHPASERRSPPTR
jgi:chemotaxis protein histidine kinase CheA